MQPGAWEQLARGAQQRLREAGLDTALSGIQPVHRLEAGARREGTVMLDGLGRDADVLRVDQVDHRVPGQRAARLGAARTSWQPTTGRARLSRNAGTAKRGANEKSTAAVRSILDEH